MKTMSSLRLVVLTALSMIAFAGNSVLCRLALETTRIDAASFTTIRLVSGALVLWLAVRRGNGSPAGCGNLLSACALFVYAAGFSFAYLRLPAGTGALLLFGAVQATMIGHGLWTGERLVPRQWLGLLLALGGLIGLLLPGISAPPVLAALLMLAAGMAWGVYSLRGRRAGDPLRMTAGNFLLAVPLAAGLNGLLGQHAVLDGAGAAYAVLSGALASGLGYAVWYAVLPLLQTAQAATVQLSVPVIATLGGMLFLGESLTLRLALASGAVLGGVALVISRPGEAPENAIRRR